MISLFSSKQKISDDMFAIEKMKILDEKKSYENIIKVNGFSEESIQNTISQRQEIIKKIMYLLVCKKDIQLLTILAECMIINYGLSGLMVTLEMIINFLTTSSFQSMEHVKLQDKISNLMQIIRKSMNLMNIYYDDVNIKEKSLTSINHYRTLKVEKNFLKTFDHKEIILIQKKCEQAKKKIQVLDEILEEKKISVYHKRCDEILINLDTFILEIIDERKINCDLESEKKKNKNNDKKNSEIGEIKNEKYNLEGQDLNNQKLSQEVQEKSEFYIQKISYYANEWKNSQANGHKLAEVILKLLEIV